MTAEGQSACRVLRSGGLRHMEEHNERRSIDRWRLPSGDSTHPAAQATLSARGGDGPPVIAQLPRARLTEQVLVERVKVTPWDPQRQHGAVCAADEIGCMVDEQPWRRPRLR